MYCGYFIWCVSCTVVVLNGFVMCGMGVVRPRQTRQLPRAVDLKGRLPSCQSY